MNEKLPFKAYSGNEPYIFICYSHCDSEYVYKTISVLNDRGFRVWYDEGCEPGYDWGSTLEEKIKGCCGFIVFISNNLLASDPACNEVRIAASHKERANIKIIPVNIDDSELTGNTNLLIGGLQQILNSNYGDDVLDKLIEALPPETHADNNENPVNAKICSPDDIIATSGRFLFNELSKYADADNGMFTNIQMTYSKIFGHFLDNEHYDGENIFADITDRFFEEYMKTVSNGNCFLKLSGTGGTGKSTFMQLLYLSFLREKKEGFLPVYFNLSFYDNMTLCNISERVTKEFTDIIEYFTKYDIVPIFFIDGVNTCQFVEKSTDIIVNELIKKVPKGQKIISIEDNFTCNRERSRPDVSIANRASEEMHFAPIDLIETEKCAELIKYAEELGRLKRGDDLLSYFKKNQFYVIDLFLIGHFAARQQETDLASRTIYDWASDILLQEYRCDNEEIISIAAKIAYRYSYTNENMGDTTQEEKKHMAKAFTMIRAHPFLNDYLIARHYIENVLNYKTGGDLGFFEVVLPKQITRFIVSKMNKDALTEERFQKFFADNYDKLGIRGKSEATFIMGRFKTFNANGEGVEFLMNELRNHKNVVATMLATKTYVSKGRPADAVKLANGTGAHVGQDYREDLFLLRGIYVSLANCGEKEIMSEYIKSLITNPYANEINRGFHLEYYGDKVYIPTTKMLNYLDDLEKGEKTIQYMCRILDKYIIKCEEEKTGEISLFTLCSLLQARMEKIGEYTHFDIKKYIKKAIKYIEQYRRPHGDENMSRYYLESEIFDQYLDSIQKDLNSYISADGGPIGASFYNTFSEASGVRRTGWVKAGIADPENIVEHSYNLMLIALFYIPPKDEWNVYDKDRIMKMLFIHDLGETIVGDIPTPEKEKDRNYDLEEDAVMRQLMLKGTYPSIANLDEYYDLWREFAEQKTDDSRLAKDIDVIQAVYQFKKYQKKYPDKFSEEAVNKWLGERRKLRTNYGKELFDKLITHNRF